MADKRKSTTTNKRVKKGKTVLTKESFLHEIGKLKLFVDGDRYYDVQVANGDLQLRW